MHTVGCSNTSYKQNISNDHCTECPMNTVSTTSGTSCVCKEGYYKSSSDNAKLSPCYGKLSKFLSFSKKMELQQLGMKIFLHVLSIDRLLLLLLLFLFL